MSQTELTISYQPIKTLRSINIIYCIASNTIRETIINQINASFSTIYITILDFTYIWNYKIVVNMAYTELIIAYKPWWIMSFIDILHYISSNSLSEIFISQRNSLFDTIYIIILHFTHSWYYNIVGNMTYPELIIAYQLLWVMRSMNILYCIASDSVPE